MKAFLTKLTAALVLGAGLVHGADAQEAFTKLHVGADPHYRPISFVEASGEVVGFDVDFAKALAERMGVPLEYEGMAWDGIIPALQSGRIDAITNIVITEERKKVVAFSQPIMQQTIVGVVRADSDNKEITAADLPNMRVGVMVNTAAATALAAIGGFEPTQYNTVVDAYNDLLLGRIDVVGVESINGGYIVASQYPDKLHVVEQPLTSDVRLNGVAVRQSDTGGLAQINAAIDQMKQDGSLAEIATKWLGSTSALPD
mgnify:CR=1 FL=1